MPSHKMITRSARAVKLVNKSTDSESISQADSDSEGDALETQVTSFEYSLELIQDEATQILRQLSNWKNLKKVEDADAEEARKKKGELEQELGEARKRISEFEQRAGETKLRYTQLANSINLMNAKQVGLEEVLRVFGGRMSELETRVGEARTLGAKLQTQTDRARRFERVVEELAPLAVKGQEHETRLIDAQAQISTLEEKILALQAQLSATSKPKPSSEEAPSPHPNKCKAKSLQPKEDSEDTAAVDSDAEPKAKKRKTH